jgi:protein-tyrosine-phosphatase
MAEAFARAYGHDVLEAVSGGLSPATAVDANTKAVMLERGLSLDKHFPKPIEEALRHEPTWIVNMSGVALPHFASHVASEAWDVRDPVGEPGTVHRQVRDRIEALVMQLILRLRKPTPSGGRVKFGRLA